jgi:hypothetical protein
MNEDKRQAFVKSAVALALGVISIGAVFAGFVYAPPGPSTFQIHDVYTRMHLALSLFWLSSIIIAVISSGLLLRESALIKKSALTAGVLAAIPLLLYFSHEPALNRGAQKRTMADMRVIGGVLEETHKHRGSYPHIRTVAELSRLVGKPLPNLDVWNYEFKIQITDSGYRIVSLGSDGKEDPSQAPGPTINFTDDIIFANGAFVRFPEGAQN